MKSVFVLILSLSLVTAFAHEGGFHTRADQFAYGSFAKAKKVVHPWPYRLLSLGHLMQSYQNYGSAYWHDGLDIRSNPGEAIHASAGGKVVNYENYRMGNPLYWEIAILDSEGFVWKYHHVDHSTIPEEIKTAFKNGGTIPAGTYLGNVVEWPVVSFGETYHHLHLLVVGADKKYINPLVLLEPLPDTSVPVIKQIGIAQNHKPLSANQVRGAHALYMEASDLILHDKFLLPPHKISYRLDRGDIHLVWEFTHLPSMTNDTDFIQDFYMKGTCGDYSCRKFYFNLNFSPEKPRLEWTLNPGRHHIEVEIEDFVGNKAVKSFEWDVLP
jgi:hypothetical protein